MTKEPLTQSQTRLAESWWEVSKDFKEPEVVECERCHRDRWTQEFHVCRRQK